MAQKAPDYLDAQGNPMTAPDVLDAQGNPLAPPQTASVMPPRTWADTAEDVAKGFVKSAGRSGLSLLEGVTKLPPFSGSTAALDAIRANPAVAERERKIRAALESRNAPQSVGGAIETGAEMMVPLGAAAEAVPTTAKAGKLFQEVMGAAKNAPVDVNASGQVALRIQQLSEHGASMPMVVRKFLGHITDPAKPPMTYETARDFASNISRLSSNEYQRLTPVVAREVANLRVTLNKSVADAAASAGKGAEYAKAMTDYARAMKIRDAVDAAVAGAKRSAPYLTAAGAGYWVTQHLKDLLD